MEATTLNCSNLSFSIAGWPENTEPPKRIFRERTKGWRLPDNTVYVGGPSIYANPFRINRKHVNGYGIAVSKFYSWLMCVEKAFPNERNIPFYYNREAILLNIHRLQGKNLACYTPLDQPSHADVLLMFANYQYIKHHEWVKCEEVIHRNDTQEKYFGDGYIPNDQHLTLPYIDEDLSHMTGYGNID
ncbi:MAG: DUF4326 domain-containing protein [Pseudomonadales bacterium]|nr:DUF4326 domain-containing protein [Pseudomonadales bacterium]